MYCLQYCFSVYLGRYYVISTHSIIFNLLYEIEQTKMLLFNLSNFAKILILIKKFFCVLSFWNFRRTTLKLKLISLDQTLHFKLCNFSLKLDFIARPSAIQTNAHRLRSYRCYDWAVCRVATSKTTDPGFDYLRPNFRTNYAVLKWQR